MTEPANQLRDSRARRDALRATVLAEADRLRARLAPPALKAQAIDAASTRATAALDEAGAVARGNKGLIAAMIAALALWFARRPLGRLAQRGLARIKAGPDSVQDDRAN